MKNSYKRREQLCKLHGPVVPGEGNAIHRINHYPVDSIVCFVSTYTLDSDLSGVKVLAPSFSVVSYNTPFILPSHLLRTRLLIWISFGYNVTSFYINIHTLIFFFSFSLYFYFILFYFFFVFRDVPECSTFLVLSTAAKK